MSEPAEDLNCNISSDHDSDVSYVPLGRPTHVQSPKKVQFPTLQEIDKNTATSGATPTSSWTNFMSCKSNEERYSKNRKAAIKLIHSSTSLDVEAETHSLASTIITDSGDTSTSTYVIESPNNQNSCDEPLVYQPPRLLPSKQGSSVPLKRSVSTDPMDGFRNCNLNAAKFTLSRSTAAVDPRLPQNFDTKFSRNSTRTFTRNLSGQSGTNKSILRRPIVPMKDANLNYTDTNISTPTMSSISSPSANRGSVDVDGNVSESIKNEMWDRVGKSCIPLAASSGRMSGREREYRTPRTRSTLSSSDYYSEREVALHGSKSASAEDALPPMNNTESKGGGRNMKKQLSNLTNILTALRQKEVVFDRASAIQALQGRILRGERVTHEEIKAIKNMTLPPHQRHLGYRLPWSTDLYCVKGLIHIPTPNKQAPSKNTFGTIEDLRIPFNNQITEEHYGRRHYIINLAGFEDDHISLYLEGKNRLVLRAERFDTLEGEDIPMTVTETILLPPDLPADNLRVVRKPSGTTIIEESWRF